MDFSTNGEPLQSSLSRELHVREKKSEQQEMARLKLLEQAQAVWMLKLAVNTKELCRTNVQLSSEIQIRAQWDRMGPWQHIDTEIIALALKSTIHVCLSPGRNSKDLSSEESGKLIQSEQGNTAEPEVPPRKASVGVGRFSTYDGSPALLFWNNCGCRKSQLLPSLEENILAIGSLDLKPSRGFLWTENELQTRTQAQHRPHSRMQAQGQYHYNPVTPQGAGSTKQTLKL